MTITPPLPLQMADNLFFMDHDHPEDGADDAESSSKSNKWEADMALLLARHLVLQGCVAQLCLIKPGMG